MNNHHKPEDVVSGELIITGHDKVSIDIDKEPHSVFVKFTDDHCPAPCNPRHCEELEWKIEKVHHHSHHHNDKKYILIIKWNVEGMRKVFWTVEFVK